VLCCAVSLCVQCDKCHQNPCQFCESTYGKTTAQIQSIPQCAGIRAKVDEVAALTGLSEADRMKKFAALVSDPELCPKKYKHVR
jgi:hypothetical protein